MTTSVSLSLIANINGKLVRKNVMLCVIIYVGMTTNIYM